MKLNERKQKLTRKHRFRSYSDLDEIWNIHCVAGKKYMVKILAALKRFKVVKFAFKVWKFTLFFVFEHLTTFFRFQFKLLKICMNKIF